MYIDQIINILNNFAITFLVVSPTIFVFSVTLLGTAIEKTRQEEKSARENEMEEIRGDIVKLEKNIKKAKKDGDITELTNRLEQLSNSQERTENKINKIKLKYNRINFTNTVLYPSFAFMFLVLVGQLGAMLPGMYSIALYVLVASQGVLLFYGVAKLFLSLNLVQEISSSKQENEIYDHLRETIKLALFEHKQDDKAKVSLVFVDKDFPLNITLSTDLTLEFRVKLEKGSVLDDLSIWFFVADGFEMIDPPEERSWRQSSDYSPPNIRTVKVKIGKLSLGPYSSGTLKVKTPAVAGRYLLKYRVYADGYKGSLKDITILVG